MKIVSSVSLALCLTSAVTSTCNAFVPTQMKMPNAARTQLSAVKKTKPADEAIAIYSKRFPPKGEYKSPFFISWGVPKNDVDGTPTSNRNSSTKSDGKRLFDMDSKQVRANFQELAKVYGAEEALQMTKDLPSILAFDKKLFKPSFVEFGKIFGQEEAKEMVMRNPGLLAVKPADAAKSDDQTMQFSYIIATTRPVGDVLLFGTLGLLMIPAVEGIAGVPFRANLLESILN
jgi:hypothetical protein